MHSQLQSNPELRDPMTTVFSFLENPSPLHRTCWFLLECYEHTHYLETEQHVPYAVILTEGSRKAIQEEKKRCPGELIGRKIPIASHSRFTVEGEVRRPKCNLHFSHMVKVGTKRKMVSLQNGMAKARSEFLVGQRLRVVFEGHFGRFWHLQDVLAVSHCPTLEQFVLGADSPNHHLQQVVLEDLPQLAELPNSRPEFRLNTLTLRSLPALKTLEGSLSCVANEVILQDLTNLSDLGDDFMYKSSVKEYRLADLPSLTRIGDSFCFGAELRSLQLDNLPELKWIGSHFLAMGSFDFYHHSTSRACGDSISTMLKSVTFSKLPKLKHIGGSFLVLCHKLASLTGFNATEIPALQSLEGNFLAGAGGPKGEFCLQGFTKLTSVGSGFLRGNFRVSRLVLSDLPLLSSIGDRFCSDSAVEGSFSLSKLPKLSKVGDDWLWNCNLTDVKLEDLPNLERIGVTWDGTGLALLKVTLAPGCPKKLADNVLAKAGQHPKALVVVDKRSEPRAEEAGAGGEVQTDRGKRNR